jgi:alpha-methylacyl-CoA racemase
VSGPLAGLSVVEFAGIGPGPFAAMMLADHGASVTRIDRPGGTIAPSGPRDTLSRGWARELTLDLASDEGRAEALALCTTVDALIEGNRPGVMERLGLGPDVLLKANPRLVYGRMTGWGQDGPMAATVGHDINYLALSGVLAELADDDGRPRPPLNLVADYAGGAMMLTFGMVAALLDVQRGGPGRVVDAAMVEGAALVGAFARTLRDFGIHDGPPGTNLLDGGAPFYRCYRCADGRWIAVGAIEPRFYAALLDGLGLHDDPSFSNQLQKAGWAQMTKRLEEFFAQRSRDEWAAHFDGTEACVSPVLSPEEASRHPHAIARRSFVDVAGVTQPQPAPRYL